MSTASVKILIEAENRASAVVDSTAKDIDNRVKAIKASGEQAKKSTEFFGVIANTLGGTELGAFASQLAGVTEKTSQFAEVQKLGGAGALAFKAGLVAAVGVLSFQVGKAFGDVIFQTQKWNDELAKATQESDKLNDALSRLTQTRFGIAREEIQLIRDPDEQLDATKKLLADFEKEIQGKQATIADILRKEQKQLSIDQDFGDDALGFNSARKEAVAKEVAEQNKLLDVLRAQRDELRNQTSERALTNKALKEENALKDKSDAYLKNLREELATVQAIAESRGKTNQQPEVELKAGANAYGKEAIDDAKQLLTTIEEIKSTTAKQEKSDSFLEGLRQEVALLRAKKEEQFAIEASQKAFGDQAVDEGTQLLREKQLLIEKRDAEKKAEDEKIAKAKQVEEIKKRELEKLEEERILLQKGKEAAYAFNLEKQGLDRADALRIAKEKVQNEQAKQTSTPELQAKESRLLTRGPGDEAARITAQNTTAAIVELKRLNALTERNMRANKPVGRGTTFTVIGAT